MKGIGEKFEVNPSNGTLSFQVPIFMTEGRHKLQPTLSLSYNSGSGNSPYGTGWNVALPSISRKTSTNIPRYNGLPTYRDEEDVFILSGYEDLVPAVADDGKVKLRTEGDYKITTYHPRTESAFARIERWKDNDSTFWKVTNRENQTSVFGYNSESQIFNPDRPEDIFQWNIAFQYDDRGNVIVYNYKRENEKNQPNGIFERNRNAFTQLYVESIKYTNKIPYPFRSSLKEQTEWLTLRANDFCFQLAFDYTEAFNTDQDWEQLNQQWNTREDPFSAFSAGFEIRTYRTCHRVLQFHHFDELSPTRFYLTKATELEYLKDPSQTQLLSVKHTGYIASTPSTYTSKSFPPVTFSYTQAKVNDHSATYSPIDLPVALNLANTSLLDINANGLPDIVYRNRGELSFFNNVGNGQFSPQEQLRKTPNLLTANQTILQSNAKGILIENYTSGTQFKYAPGTNLFSSPSWEQQAIHSLPNIDRTDPRYRFIDLNGDGVADVISAKNNAYVTFMSTDEEAYEAGPQVQWEVDEEQGPKANFRSTDKSIRFADLSGDGMPDIVRITQDTICYWPNLGYGKFGSKVTMASPPKFEASFPFNEDRIMLADLDGTGPTDLLYIGHNNVQYFKNLSGNAWAKPIDIPTPPISSLNQVKLVDIYGEGNICLIISPLQYLGGERDKVVRLFGSVAEQTHKPNLLCRINNGRGAINIAKYKPSTHYYLDDLKQNEPWISSLPFPVQLVDKVITIDLIAQTAFKQANTYHHGYFDQKEREFRGFARVDSYDSEEFTPEELQTIGFDPLNLDHKTKPVLTKSWFHTGFHDHNNRLSTFLATEYFRERNDVGKLTNKDWLLEDSVYEAGISTLEKRTASRALKGSMLRQEVYHVEDDNTLSSPYTVTEQNFLIRKVQEQLGNRHAVFQVLPKETINYHYEQQNKDPRISHQLNLVFGKYGEVTDGVAINYPRRVPAHRQQAATKIAFTKQTFIHVDQSYGGLRIGLPYTTETFEVLNVPFGRDKFSAPELKSILDGNLPVIELHKEPGNSSPHLRLLNKTKIQYAGEDPNIFTPWGNASLNGLPYQSYQLAFSEAMLDTFFRGDGKTITSGEISGQGHYVNLVNEIDRWWIPSGTLQYGAAYEANFYSPIQIADAFKNTTTIEYDPYLLHPIKTINPIGHETSVSDIDGIYLNYRVGAPFVIVDLNDNYKGFRFDELGMLIGEATMGKYSGGNKYDDVNWEGNFIDLSSAELTSEDRFTTRMAYSLQNQGSTPPYVKTIQRLSFSSAPPLVYGDRQFYSSILFSDGLGREIGAKEKVEAGRGWQQDASGNWKEIRNGNPAFPISNRWVGTGRIVYNNKVKPVQEYEPYFVEGDQFDEALVLRQNGVSPFIHYDPLQRPIQIDYPDGSYEKSTFNAWEQLQFDQNDTAYDPINGNHSDWYNQATSARASKSQKDAAAKVKSHADTPTLTILDTLGRPLRSIQDNGIHGKYATTTLLDFVGNQTTVIDPLNRSAATFNYDYANRNLRHWYADSGRRWIFPDVAEKPVMTWDEKGSRFSHTYDELQRPVKREVTPVGEATYLSEFIIYGQQAPSAKSHNLLGQPVLSLDQSGSAQQIAFDFQGNLLETRKGIRKAYQGVEDWTNVATTPSFGSQLVIVRTLLRADLYTFKYTYDSLGKMLTQETPDSAVQYNTYNEGTLLEKIDFKYAGTIVPTPVVLNLDYNEKGQTERIRFDNQSNTRYEYDPKTFRLARLSTRSDWRGNGPELIQDTRYTYDPVGNITRLTEAVIPYLKNGQPINKLDDAFVVNGQRVTPFRSYTYDSIYQLRSATGREQQRAGAIGCRELVPHAFPNTGQVVPYDQQYQYDELGNILQLKHHINNNTSTGWTRNYQYDYSTPNNYLGSTRLTNGPTTDYAYDAHGNTQDLCSKTFQWDADDQIKQIDLGGGGFAYYQYDAAGIRTRKLVQYQNGTLKERIYLDGFEVYQEYKNIAQLTANTPSKKRNTVRIGSEEKVFLQADQLIVESSAAVNEQAVVRYQYDNYLGSAALELDTKGQLISLEEYHPFGTTAYRSHRNIATVSIKLYRYSGKERDEESGLYYYGARYYISWLGRWCKSDPSRHIDGLCVFTFTKNNPINLYDLDGRMSASEYTMQGFKTLIGGLFEFVAGGNITNANRVENANLPNGKGGILGGIVRMLTLYQSDIENNSEVAESGSKLVELLADYSNDYLVGTLQLLSGENINGEKINREDVIKGIALTFTFNRAMSAGGRRAKRPRLPNGRFKKYKKTPAAPLTTKPTKSAGKANYEQGQAGESSAGIQLTEEGFEVISNQVKISTPFGERISDLVVTKNGKIGIVEVKTGNAKYDTLQRKKDDYIADHGGVVINDPYGIYQKGDLIKAPTIERRTLHHGWPPKNQK